LTGTEAARHAVAPQNPYTRAEEFAKELRTIEASLQTNHGKALVAERQPLIRAGDGLGFVPWTCQSSDKTRGGRRLLATAGIESHYSALDEAANAAC
jgi:phosphoenolpyruvate carboxylase